MEIFRIRLSAFDNTVMFTVLQGFLLLTTFSYWASHMETNSLVANLCQDGWIFSNNTSLFTLPSGHLFDTMRCANSLAIIGLPTSAVQKDCQKLTYPFRRCVRIDKVFEREGISRGKESSGERLEGSPFWEVAIDHSINWGENREKRNMDVGWPKQPHWLNENPGVLCRVVCFQQHRQWHGDTAQR